MRKPYTHLQSQGHVKMAYRLASVLLIDCLAGEKTHHRFNKQIRLHIFDDVGVAAAEL